MSVVLKMALAVVGLAFAILAVLKLTGIIDWPWLAITALLWAPLGVAAVVAFVVLMAILWALRGRRGVP